MPDRKPLRIVLLVGDVVVASSESVALWLAAFEEIIREQEVYCEGAGGDG